ncbi:DUF47 domain-containing protein [Chrysiogenes arsenatis]|uniref:DUF47 domain-containing protein n=1 Tax=Chrysiogenes arsenatis TaxID=309797 RepID=UPI000402D849|nr:DUF47 family protein [Chrysiogenes arsenatis]
MRSISGLWGPDPSSFIAQHMRAVKECIDCLDPAIEHWLNEDFAQLKLVAKKVMKFENDADRIKTTSETSFPSSFFLNIKRSNYFELIRSQDSIADQVEDLMFILTVRQTVLHSGLRVSFDALYGRVRDILQLTFGMSDDVQSLFESGFSEIHKASLRESIAAIEFQEWECDKRLYKFAQQLYALENEISPVTIYMLAEITKKLGSIANSAEQTAKNLSLILAN